MKEICKRNLFQHLHLHLHLCLRLRLQHSLARARTHVSTENRLMFVKRDLQKRQEKETYSSKTPALASELL